MRPTNAKEPVTRATARNCFLINQFATPGLGSVMAGRWLPGIGQLLLAFTGFAAVVGWVALTLYESYKLMDLSAQPRSYTWLGIAGGILFGISWIWSLFTSISVFRQSREPAGTKPPPVP